MQTQGIMTSNLFQKAPIERTKSLRVECRPSRRFCYVSCCFLEIIFGGWDPKFLGPPKKSVFQGESVVSKGGDPLAEVAVITLAGKIIEHCSSRGHCCPPKLDRGVTCEGLSSAPPSRSLFHGLSLFQDSLLPFIGSHTNILFQRSANLIQGPEGLSPADFHSKRRESVWQLPPFSLLWDPLIPTPPSGDPSAPILLQASGGHLSSCPFAEPPLTITELTAPTFQTLHLHPQTIRQGPAMYLLALSPTPASQLGIPQAGPGPCLSLYLWLVIPGEVVECIFPPLESPPGSDITRPITTLVGYIT